MPKMNKKKLEQYLLMFVEDQKAEKEYTEQYTAFYSSVFQLSVLLTNFDEVSKEKKKSLRPADILQLRKAYEDVLIKANHFKTAAAASNVGEMPELAGRIAGIDSFCEYISADMISLSNVAETDGKTIDDIFDDARSYTIDISGQSIDKAGANMSSRIPVSFVDKNGKTLKGFFTPETKVSRDDETVQMFADAKKDHPEYDLALRIIINDFRFESYTSAIENVTASVNTYLQSDNILDVYNDLAKDILEQSMDQRGDMTEEEYKEYIAGLSTDKEFSMRLLNMFREYGQIQNKHTVYDAVGIDAGSIIEQRNAAMSVMGDLIGTPNLLARSVQMTISEYGVKTKGVFMGFAEGSDLMHMKEDDPLKDVTYEQLDNPDLMKQLADLQVLDYICGNTDRHMGNMFYQFKETENGKVLSGIVGIDNDNSFGKKEMSKSSGLMSLPGINSLMVINEETAARIKGLSLPMVSVALKNYSLSADELNAAWDRITLLQQKILEGEQYYRDNPGAKPEPPNLKTVSNEEWNSIKLRELSVREADGSVQEGHYKNYFANVATLPTVVSDTIEHQKKEKEIKANIEAKHPELKKDENGFKMAKGEVFLETNKAGITDNNRRLTSLEADMKAVNKGMFISSKQFNDIIRAFNTVRKLSSGMNEGVSNEYLEKLNDAYGKLNEKIDIYLVKKESEKKEKLKKGKEISLVHQSRVEFAEELKEFVNERIDGLDNELARTKNAERFASESMVAKFSNYVKNRIARQNDHMLDEISKLPLNDPYSKIKANSVNSRNFLLDYLVDKDVPNFKKSKIKENIGELILATVAENYRKIKGPGSKLEKEIGNADSDKYRSIINAVIESPHISKALQNVNKQTIKEFLLDNKAKHLINGMPKKERKELDKKINDILNTTQIKKEKTKANYAGLN